MTRRVLDCVPVALLTVLLVSSAQAGQPRTHDGLFLRLSGGFGVSESNLDQSGGDIELSGIGGDGNFAIGGIVSPNLAINGTLWGWDVSDPDVEIGDFSGEANGDLSLGAVGGGVTYYLMPSNVYLSGSLGLGKLSFEDPDGNSGDTDYGLAFDACVGKEWWVGNGWGLGVAGDLNFHSLGDDISSENWQGVSFAIRFSATMN